MDPLSAAIDASAAYQAEAEAEVVLFSRPINFMPTNPFATLRNYI
jgi:hypothetical protein